MAQVINPGRREGTGFLDAAVRLLQGYQAYQGARESSAKADATQNQQENEANGVLSRKEQLGLAGAGYKFSPDPSPGAVEVQDSQEGYKLYATPPKPKDELKIPGEKPQEYKDANTGEIKIGRYIEGKGLVTAPNDATAKSEAKQTNLQAHTYYDEQNKVFRTGAFDPQSGQVIRRPNDPVAKPEDNQRLSKVTSQTAQEIGSYDSAIDIANQIEAKYNKQASQPGAGLVQFAPGSNANLYSKDRAVAAQTIGTILEKGKLTDRDYDKYYGMLPSPSDTNAQAQEKLAAIKALILSKKRNEIEGLRQSGFDTSNYAPVPKEVPTNIIGRKESAPTGVAHGAPVDSSHTPGSIIEISGKRYQVGPDGKTATPLKAGATGEF